MAIRHPAPHPLAGKNVVIKSPGNDGLDQACCIEDYRDRIAARDLLFEARWIYAMRSVFDSLPVDNEVVYGKVNGFGCLIHVSEIGRVLD